MFTHAITRQPGENFALGITTSGLGKPDYMRMLSQHNAYVETLKSLGLEVTVLPALPGYPDAYFVEDAAVVTRDIAVITRPGVKARQGEEIAIEPELARYREIARIEAPGTLEGGDVLMVGRHFFIGVSERTNQEGARQLGKILEKYGNASTAVPVGDGLHLKSSVNYIGNSGGRHTLLITEEFCTLSLFNGYEKIIVGSTEAHACNTLLVNERLITPRGFPKTLKELKKLGMGIIELDMSEAQKMDGGLTCMSLRF